MKYETCKNFCDLKGYNHRKMRYEAMADYFSLDPETIRDIISFDRYLRDLLKIDEIGEEKARDWRPSGSFKKEECRLDIELPRILSQ